MSVYNTLKQLGIELPVPSQPAAAYLMSAQSGNTVYLSGHLARRNGQVWTGKLGQDLDVETGKYAARAAAVDLIATLHEHTGDLNQVKRIIKMVSLVNTTPAFTDQHLVTNGASDLLIQVFGECGQHARVAFGVAQLPLGACVELELMAVLK